jgi:hypothetical protein
MEMTTYYKAIFPDGTMVMRASDSERSYSHAWKHSASYTYKANNTRGGFRREGFSAREELARKAAALPGWLTSVSYDNLVTSSDVAPAIEITSAEYRALKKGGA